MTSKIESIVYGILCIIMACSLTSCGRIIDWGKGSFYQGEKVDPDLMLVRDHIKSTVVYDQLKTVLQIDALWLSDPVREVYSDIYSHLAGKGDEYKMTLQKRQREENSRFIIFYVLSSYKIPLGVPESVWQLFLKIDENHFSPIEIKTIELAPLYQKFFGKKYSVFKVAYQVKFDAKDMDNNSLIKEGVKKIALCFRSLYKEAALEWMLNEFALLQTEDDQKDQCG